MAEQCDNCKFYRLRTYGAKTAGECRVSEPEASGGWPRVETTDWCGKYVVAVLMETKMLGEIPL